MFHVKHFELSQDIIYNPVGDGHARPCTRDNYHSKYCRGRPPCRPGTK